MTDLSPAIYRDLHRRVEAIATLIHDDTAITAVTVDVLARDHGDTRRARLTLTAEAHKLTVKVGGALMFRGPVNQFWSKGDRRPHHKRAA